MTRAATRIAAGSGVALVVAFAIGVFVSTSALAATYTVTTDSGNPATAGSLPYEIGLANTAGGTNTITFASTANGTITLTSGELELTGSQTLTITGNGASNTVISGNGASRVFEVDAGVSLSLSGVTVENGSTNEANGSGIDVDGGSLDLSDSTVTGNAGDDDDGVGIVNNGSGTVTITQSTVSNNTVTEGSGGGAANNGSGTFNILDSTFVGNVSDIRGGGILVQGGTLNIIDSTFNDNSGLGGAISTFHDDGSIDIIDSTLADNPSSEAGDDIFILEGDTVTVTVAGSILTNSGGSTVSCSGAVTDGGYNIDNGTSCGFTAASDHSSTDPDLGSLASNGGPTQTMALDAGSAAIEAGESGTACTSVNDSEDQRGYERPGVAGTACSIGAYEYGASAPTTTVPVPTSGAVTGSSPALPWGIVFTLFGVAALLLITTGLRARNRRPI
jgi:hypothetical protein